MTEKYSRLTELIKNWRDLPLDAFSWHQTSGIISHQLAGELEQLQAECKRYREALEAIRDFGHAKDCESPSVPVYECCCYKKSQWDIAKQALTEEA